MTVMGFVTLTMTVAAPDFSEIGLLCVTTPLAVSTLLPDWLVGHRMGLGMGHVVGLY